MSTKSHFALSRATNKEGPKTFEELSIVSTIHHSVVVSIHKLGKANCYVIIFMVLYISSCKN